MIRVLFIGTAEFAVPSLQKLIDLEGVEVIGIVTQPDRPVGRSQELQGGPVKKYWQQNLSQTLPIFQPEKLRIQSEEILRTTSPDLVIVAAYGQMIPDDILNTPKFGAWNIHGSLLPKLRGAVPVQRAILDGLEITGVTIQQMVKQLDAGDILLQQEYLISPRSTAGQLMDELAKISANLLVKAIEMLTAGELVSSPQEHDLATFCFQSDISKHNAQITEDTNLADADRMVRGFNPWPIAWINIPTGKYAGMRLKIYSVSRLVGEPTGQFELIELEGDLALSLPGGMLVLDQIQLEGRTKSKSSEYLYLLK